MTELIMDHIDYLMRARDRLLALNQTRPLTFTERLELSCVLNSLLQITIAIHTINIRAPRTKITPPKFLPIVHPPKKISRAKRSKRPKTNRRKNKTLYQPR